jgi:hypothetical protein
MRTGLSLLLKIEELVLLGAFVSTKKNPCVIPTVRFPSLIFISELFLCIHELVVSDGMSTVQQYYERRQSSSYCSPSYSDTSRVPPRTVICEPCQVIPGGWPRHGALCLATINKHNINQPHTSRSLPTSTQ